MASILQVYTYFKNSEIAKKIKKKRKKNKPAQKLLCENFALNHLKGANFQLYYGANNKSFSFD